MKIYKFGGASLKDAWSLENMARIISARSDGPLVMIVSAMGKTTNALEKIFHKAFSSADYEPELDLLYQFHARILENIYSDTSMMGKILDPLFNDLRLQLTVIPEEPDADKAYDMIIPFGELISSEIVYHYLQHHGYPVLLIDARQVIKTNEVFREAGILWEETKKRVNKQINSDAGNSVFLSQGFIGSTLNNQPVTLGREGSDFTAAIFAWCLEAQSVTIWKDVPGILNADPKNWPETTLYHNLSYQEAAEMTYYGATVIHPKTIKPLANKNIPLYVRSFLEPENQGTLINEGEVHVLPPTFVFKEQQCLVTFKMPDMEFISEKSLSQIFQALDELNLKINMMQNSATSLTVCFNLDNKKLDQLLQLLEPHFRVLYNQDLTLITVKNYDPQAIEAVSRGKEILVEQRTRHTYQIIIR